MSQPSSAAQWKGKRMGRGRTPDAKTANREPGAARQGLVPGSKTIRPHPRVQARFTRLTAQEMNYTSIDHGVMMYLQCLNLMRPMFLCVLEFLDKDIKAPSCPRCCCLDNVNCTSTCHYIFCFCVSFSKLVFGYSCATF